MRISDWSSDVCSSDLVQTCGGLTGVRAKAALGGDHGSVSLEGFHMEFHVRLDGARPDLDALGDAIREVDPSALLDIDSSGALLRVAAAVQAPELIALLGGAGSPVRSEEHTSELQSLMRIPYAVFCLKKKK